MFRLDPSWALGPIAAVGYESEVGNSGSERGCAAHSLRRPLSI
jgi:hypothetical protein